jgi:hypothetical protein
MDDEPEDVESSLEKGIVHVESALFNSDVYNIYDLPHKLVVDALLTPEPLRSIKSMGLFKIALPSEELVDKLDPLSWREMTELTNQWIEKSDANR